MSGFRHTLGYLMALLVLLAVGGGAYLFLNDLDGPQIVMLPDTGRISPHQDIQVTLSDAKHDIRSVAVSVRKREDTLVVFEKGFTSASPIQKVTFNLKNTGLRDGPFQLEIKARDTALAGFGSGNVTTKVWDMHLDTRPPSIKVRTTAPALRRGSVAVIAYSLSEEVDATGIRLGKMFFPAFRQANGLYYCFFAFPLKYSLETFTPEIVARDLAGNVTRTRVIVNAMERAYRSDTLTISDRFLDTKMPAFTDLVPTASTNLERYVKMNNEVRADNEKTLLEIGRRTAPNMLWSGAFQRLPRSAVKANFGDDRTYMYNGQKIDRQTHMGLDLASVARAPIPAANDGTVVFAEPLGIYGNLVVVDHGLGLQTLYSHLSEIMVRTGDVVKKGDTLGRTGTTGLAGGDHLHFGVMLAGIEVQPIDWLDKNWIKNTITDRLAAASR